MRDPVLLAMSFFASADAYDRFMGRYSRLLSPLMADFATVAPGDRVLDVGCGPGALTAVLVERAGAEVVTAVDPSEPFVAAVRSRHPNVDIRVAAAEDLPFAGGSFDRVLAQLVVHFMADPVAGLAEMRRVTRPGGIVAACVWDHHGGQGPLGAFWRAVHELDPTAPGEGELPGTREGHLEELFERAGIREVESTALVVDREHASFDEWWEPYTHGVGPAGAYVAGLDDSEREVLRLRCRASLPDPPFVIRAVAWGARGRA